MYFILPRLLLSMDLFIEAKDHSNIPKVTIRIGNWYSEIKDENAVVVPIPKMLDMDVRVNNPRDDEQLMHPVESMAKIGDNEREYNDFLFMFLSLFFKLILQLFLVLEDLLNLL